MASPSRPDPIWKHLGDLLTKRRIDLDHRYANRRTFCTEMNVDYRVISDIEGGRRDNFSRPTIVQIETAYRLARGNIERIVQGGEIEPLEPPTRVSQVQVETPALDVIDNPDFDLDLVAEKLHGFRTGRQGEEERRIAAMTRSPWYDRVAAIEMLRRVVDAEERRSEGQDKRPSRGA
jgi:hypothetical protein